MKELKAQTGSWFRQRRAPWLPGAGLVMLAVALVGLRLLWLRVERPAHLEENAAAYGSIGNFYGPVRMNHDGSQFTYVTIAADRGHALFLCDTATGKKGQIIEDRQGVGYFGDDFAIQAGPWSPDDSCFLCVVSNRPMVFSANTRQGQAVIDGEPFSDAVWLTPTKFACVADGTNLCLAQKSADGQWDQKIFLSRNVPLTSLAAISSDAVAWLENDDVICQANLSENDSGAGILSAGGNAASQPPTNGLALWLDASKLRQPDQTRVLDLPDLSRNKNDAHVERDSAGLRRHEQPARVERQRHGSFWLAGFRHEWDRLEDPRTPGHRRLRTPERVCRHAARRQTAR